MTQGPLTIPGPAPTTEAAVAAQGLRAHSTAADWIPEGLSPELDQIRAEHARVRELVLVEINALAALGSRLSAEDKAYDRDLRSALREGRKAMPKDSRTALDERRAAEAKIRERLWAAAEVLSEVVRGVTFPP